MILTQPGLYPYQLLFRSLVLAILHSSALFFIKELDVLEVQREVRRLGQFILDRLVVRPKTNKSRDHRGCCS